MRGEVLQELRLGRTLQKEAVWRLGVSGDTYFGELFEVLGSPGVVEDVDIFVVGNGGIVGGVCAFDAVVDLFAQRPQQFLFLHPHPFDDLTGMRPQQSERFLALHILALHRSRSTKFTCDSICA